MAAGRPVGRVGIGDGYSAIDPTIGRVVSRTSVDRRDSGSPEALRNHVKRLHRMTTFGNGALLINIIVSISLTLLIVTGVTMYLKLLAMRRKIRKPNPFWPAGGGWRSLHRSISIMSAAFLLVVTTSGAWLAVECLGLAIYFVRHHGPAAATPPVPLVDKRLPGMLRTTLAAAAREAPGAGYVVVRLRRYGGYDQGVVVTGGEGSRQYVYDAATGRPMSLTEAGYPEVPFPFGWQAHQIAKSVHRGDFFGLTGRIIDLLAGFAMVYLSVSGIVMYYTMWKKHRDAGRRALIWR